MIATFCKQMKGLSMKDECVPSRSKGENNAFELNVQKRNNFKPVRMFDNIEQYVLELPRSNLRWNTLGCYSAGIGPSNYQQCQHLLCRQSVQANMNHVSLKITSVTSKTQVSLLPVAKSASKQSADSEPSACSSSFSVVVAVFNS